MVSWSSLIKRPPEAGSRHGADIAIRRIYPANISRSYIYGIYEEMAGWRMESITRTRHISFTKRSGVLLRWNYLGPELSASNITSCLFFKLQHISATKIVSFVVFLCGYINQPLHMYCFRYFMENIVHTKQTKPPLK